MSTTLCLGFSPINSTGSGCTPEFASVNDTKRSALIEPLTDPGDRQSEFSRVNKISGESNILSRRRPLRTSSSVVGPNRTVAQISHPIEKTNMRPAKIRNNLKVQFGELSPVPSLGGTDYTRVLKLFHLLRGIPQLIKQFAR